MLPLAVALAHDDRVDQHQTIEARGLCNPQGITALLDEHLAEMTDHRKPLFTLLAFEISYWRASANYEQSLADLETLTGGTIR